MFIKITQQPPWKLHPQLVASTPFQGTMFVWCFCKCKTQLLLSFFLLGDGCDCSCGSCLKLSFEVVCPSNSWFGWLDLSFTPIWFIWRGEWDFLHCLCKTLFVRCIFLMNWIQICMWFILHTRCRNHFWCPCGKKWAEQAESLRGCSHKVELLTWPLETSALQSGGDCPPAPLIPWAFWAGDDPEGINKPEFLLDPGLFACTVGTEVRNCAKLYSWEQKHSSAFYIHINKRVSRTWGILTQSWEYCFHACVMQVTQLKNTWTPGPCQPQCGLCMFLIPGNASFVAPNWFPSGGICSWLF